MRRKRIGALLVVASLAMACGGGGLVEANKDLVADSLGDLGKSDAANEIETSETLAETLDLAPLDLPDLSTDLGDECQPGDGCFLDPCTDGQECLSGICVDHMGDSVCTLTCVEECPGGWLCEQIGAGPDAMFACVSPYTHLCRPCSDSNDCKSPTGVEDVCVDYGPDGNFCGADCSESGLCPDGYSCVDAMTVEGGNTLQCMPDSGECTCSAKSVQLALTTPCELTNEFGTCTGLRQCSADGLSDCDAPDPAAEVCDGVDNDCNGSIDDVTCDDGDACTEDTCLGEGGCAHAPLTGTACDDGNVCTLADHCDAGQCVGTAINCDDNNPCTADSCDPTGGCIYTFNNSPCDDGDPCTVNDACKQGTCQGFAVPCECQKDSDCVDFEDDDVCNGTLFCDLEAFPQKCAVDPDTIIECPAPEGLNAECLAASCHPVTGECSFHPGNEGGACEDGDACTIGDQCVQGECIAQVALNCNDGNPCTTDSCDPESGCLYADNSEPCNDGNPCTVGDLCSEGLCTGGAPLDCDDQNLCTDDSCDPGLGCVHAPNSVPCDDGSMCTPQDQCVGGQCTGLSTIDCDDQNLCTTDWCDPALGCVHDANSVPCDDGNACTTGDQCAAGECAGNGNLDCDDGNVCTDDSCDPGQGCLHAPNSAPCDDNNTCTTGDVCANGACAGVGSLECDDGNPCTKDICTPQGGCEHQNIAGACDDGDPCTINDVCDQGACVGGGALDCNDNNPCTDDSCLAGVCQHEANLAACDDGNPCTEGDTCEAGVCTFTGLTDCDDENLCTTDYCDPNQGCMHSVNNAPCDDGDACTTKDQCSLGECVGSTPPVCNDNNPCTDDGCDSEVGCVYTPNAADCDDGNACTTGDHCAGGSCVTTGMLNCNDNDLCTDDSCNAVDGCVHTPNSNPCDDGNLCTVYDHCEAGLCVGGGALGCSDNNPCTDDSCIPDVGCSFVANAAPCDDGDACTADDLCGSGICQPGGAVDCDDGNVCTDDSCDPATGCLNVANTIPCDDGSFCTIDDVCGAGQCAGTPLNCDDGLNCTDDSCDPDFGCVHAVVPNCCGNGIVEGGEECDDGNEVGGDGCSQSCVSELYWVSGPQTNVNPSTLTGWTACHHDTYNMSNTTLSTVLSKCSGSKLMLACRPVGQTNFTLLAMAPRADVTYDTGENSNVVHNANGSDWYFHSGWSWGFAAPGTGVSKGNCDTAGTQADKRLCIHANSGLFYYGWRCGSTTGLNSNSSWERYVYHAP